MTKLYISGPMTGIPEWNYPAFNNAEKRLIATGYEVVNPASLPKQESWEAYLRQDLMQMLDCDGLALLPGSLGSKGAKLEIHVASSLGMEIKAMAQWEREGTTLCTITQGDQLCIRLQKHAGEHMWAFNSKATLGISCQCGTPPYWHQHEGDNLHTKVPSLCDCRRKYTEDHPYCDACRIDGRMERNIHTLNPNPCDCVHAPEGSPDCQFCDYHGEGC